MGQIAEFSVTEGGASPQSPLEIDGIFDGRGEDTGQASFPSCLLSYSEETAYLLDAPPSWSSVIRAGTSSSNQSCKDQGSSPEHLVQKELLSKLLSTPPGRFGFLCDASDRNTKIGVQSSTLFGALHHAHVFDSGGQSTHTFQSLSLSIPSLEELPPEELLNLAAQGSRSFAQETDPTEREDLASSDLTALLDSRQSVFSRQTSVLGPDTSAGVKCAFLSETAHSGATTREGANSNPSNQTSIQGSDTTTGAKSAIVFEAVKTGAESGAQTTREGEDLATDAFATWLAAAAQPPAGLIAHSWEEAAGGIDGRDFTQKRVLDQGLQDGAFLTEQEVDVFDRAYRRYASKALREAPVVVQESTLVRDALYALQGVPSSLIRLESQAAPPIKRGVRHPPSVRLTSTGPSSIQTLLKPLLEAGRLRQRLESFAQGQTGPLERGLSSSAVRGLVLQAFGGALQTVLLCQTAALDRIGQSVRARRGRERPSHAYGNGAAARERAEGPERELDGREAVGGVAEGNDRENGGTEAEASNGNGTEAEMKSAKGTETERPNGSGAETEPVDRNGTGTERPNGNGTETELSNGTGTVDWKRRGKRKNLETIFAAVEDDNIKTSGTQASELFLGKDKVIVTVRNGGPAVSANAVNTQRGGGGASQADVKKPSAGADTQFNSVKEQSMGAGQPVTGVKGLQTVGSRFSDGVNMRSHASNGLVDGVNGLLESVNGLAAGTGGLADGVNCYADGVNGLTDGVNGPAIAVNGPSDAGGTVTSNNVGDLTLLELLLHSQKLRTQVHVLGRLCRRLGGFGGLGELEESVGGPELLSRLFDEVLDADPAHSDVHRFLLSSACQPYLELVRAWLYQQPVEDPYQEFIVEQSEEVDPATGMKVFRTAKPPSFLAEVWQPLIRAGQQLHVLLDLPQTRELAETILSRPDWRPAQTLNPFQAKPPVGRVSFDGLLDGKPTNHSVKRPPGGVSSSGVVSTPGLVFSANRLRELAADGRERARRKETEAGWSLTMLAMQERRRCEGKLDSIEQHRSELAKTYDDQRTVSVTERENERSRKDALLKEQREEIERRAEVKRRSTAARVERERALLREERELEAAEVARAKAAMVAEAEGQLADLDRRIREAEQRTAAMNGGNSRTEAPTGSVGEIKSGGALEVEETAGVLPRPVVKNSTGDVRNSTSASDGPDGPEQEAKAARSGGIDLDEWHRLAQLETSDSGLFGSEGGIRTESSAEASLGGLSPGVDRESDRGEGSPGGLAGEEQGMSEGAGTVRGFSERGNGKRADEEGVSLAAGSGTGVEEDDVTAVLKNLILDLEDKNRVDSSIEEGSEGKLSGPAEDDEDPEPGESGRGAVDPVSKWGPPEDFAPSAGLAREGLGVSASAQEAARKGREMEGREMRDVMDGGFGGFDVAHRWDDRDADKSSTNFDRSGTTVKWAASGDPFPAAGMSTKALGDVFAAQDFRFVGGVDFRDRGTKHSPEPPLKDEPDSFDPVSNRLANRIPEAAEEDVGFWAGSGLANVEPTRVPESEPSREALTFLSPIPSGSGTPTNFPAPPLTPPRYNQSPTTIATPVAPTGRRQTSPTTFAPKMPDTAPGRPESEQPDDDSNTPLSVVLDVCVVREILAQYRCVSLCCVRVFQEELALPAHCAALRRYLFMLAGDVADAFVAALLSQKWGPSGGASRQAEVQALLESALQTSSCRDDKFAERLQVRVEQTSKELQGLPDVYAPWVKASLTPGGFVDLGRVDAFDFIQLEYHVDWPLTLVLTSAAIKQYQAVFRFLLRAKHATFSLRDVWRDLQVLSRRLAKRGPGVSAHVFSEQQRQLREAQLFRQAITHVVTTLAGFVQAQLLDVAWTRYQERVRTEVVDLHDLRQVHSEYLADATRHCLMGESGAAAKSHIDEIFQQLLDFRRHLRRAVRTLDQPAAELEIDEVNQQIKQTKEAFQESFRTLYVVHLRPQVQNVEAIRDVCMRLNFNGFVEERIAN